jgi:hypothetical protein
MLEILVIIGFSRKIAAICKEKGRSAVGWIVMFIGLWFGGEVLGAIVGTVAGLAAGGGEEPGFLIPWICGLVGAACGAAVAFAIVNGLPSLQQDEYWQAPESEAYREKFEPGRYQDQQDDGAYRSKVNGSGAPQGTDAEAAYRARAEEV